MLSACWMVESRWATISMVPMFFIFSRESWMRISVSVSMLAVASSRIMTSGRWMMVRAKLRSCRCPAEKLLPRSRTVSSKPFSILLMKESALT